MRASPKRSLIGAALASIGVILAAVYFRLRGRSSPPPVAMDEESEPLVELLTAEPIPIQKPQDNGWFWPIVFIALAYAGLFCLIGAQSWISANRWPLTPIVLYIIGIPLLLPLLSAHAAQTPPTESTPLTLQTETRPLENRRLYILGAGFFALLGVVLAQGGRVNPLLIFAWVMSIALICISLEGMPRRQNLFLAMLRWLRTYISEIVIALALMGLGVWVQANTPNPVTPLSIHNQILTAIVRRDNGLMIAQSNPDVGVLYAALQIFTASDFSGLITLSSLFAVLLIPAVYALGFMLEGRLTGLVAAAFTAVSGWTLALGKSGQVYPALALVGVLFIITLLAAVRHPGRFGWIRVGLLLGLGWLISPLFIYVGLLIPAWLVIEIGTDRKGWEAALRIMLTVGLVTIVTLLPFALAPRIASPTVQSLRIDISPSLRYMESLSSSLLLFNLTGDPNPLHGLPDRPVFAPLLAAGFLIGLLAHGLRANRSRNKKDWFVLIGLVICLVPAALVIDLPIRYPDLQRAALALPLGMVIAACGLTLFAQLLIKLLGRWGLAIALGLLALGMAQMTNDSRDFYTRTALPAYEQAAPTENLLTTPR